MTAFPAVSLFLMMLVPYGIIAVIVAFLGREVRLERDYSYCPAVSVVVPTYNEERNIATKLDNLLTQSYPLSEILVVDCSKDGTRGIVREYQSKYPNIRLIEQAQRVGMPETLNLAYSIASGELVIKTDCDSINLSNHAIRDLVAAASDTAIGGVSSVCVGKGIEGPFRKLITKLQIAESNLDSTIIAHASMFCLKKKDVDKIPADCVNEDAAQFVAMRKRGRRTIIDPSVKCVEEVPDQFLQRRIQKDRRAEGTIRVLLSNLSVCMNPRYGLYGLVVFPIDLFLLVLSPFALITAYFAAAYALVSTSPISLAAFALVGILGLLVYKSGRPSWCAALIDLQICGLIGTLRALALKSNPMWKRVRM
jgi:cellulose synthase/poly-beta-1,6-N-acetylglucosamine synthase-like glycosyltransferase